jgi:hypothetical protein
MAMSWIPTIETGLILEGMFENKTLSACLASGIIDLDTLAATARGGDYINIGRQPLPADFARVDISSTVDLTPTAVSTKAEKAVVLRDASMNKFNDHDSIRVGKDVGDNIARGLGDKLAKRICTQLFRGTIGAIQALSTSHTVDVIAATAITAHDIRKAKLKLGDEADKMSTLVMTSAIWGDLLRDLIETYKIDVVGGKLINSGRTESLMGIRNIIVTDLVPDDQFTTSSDTVGVCLLYGPNALYMAYQRAMQVEYQKNILQPSTLQYVKASMDWIGHPHGSTWGGSNNPTDAAWGLSGNWTQQATDHRECNYAMIVAKEGVYS